MSVAISKDPEAQGAGDAAEREFTTSRRGYNREEVRGHLRRVAGRIRALEAELRDERAKARFRVERPPAPSPEPAPRPQPLERRLAAAVRAVEEAAERSRAAAAEEAERLLSEARAEAERLLSEARAEAERLLADSSAPFDALLAAGPEAMFDFEQQPPEAGGPVEAAPEPVAGTREEPAEEFEERQDDAVVAPPGDVSEDLKRLAQEIWHVSSLDDGPDEPATPKPAAPTPAFFAYRPADRRHEPGVPLEDLFGES